MVSRLTEILEATAASHEGGFGSFARKNPRRKDPREKGKQEFKNPNRTRFDDMKDKAGQMKDKAKKYFDAGHTSKSSREARRQAKIQRASDAASDSIAQDTPTTTKFNKQQAVNRDETSAHITNRSLKKGDYKDERRKFIDKNQRQQQQQSQPQKLVPLHRSDESRVRQLAKRLNPTQAEQLGQMIGNIMNPPKSEGTAERVAKR